MDEKEINFIKILDILVKYKFDLSKKDFMEAINLLSQKMVLSDEDKLELEEKYGTKINQSKSLISDQEKDCVENMKRAADSSPKRVMNWDEISDILAKWKSEEPVLSDEEKLKLKNEYAIKTN